MEADTTNQLLPPQPAIFASLARIHPPRLVSAPTVLRGPTVVQQQRRRVQIAPLGPTVFLRPQFVPAALREPTQVCLLRVPVLIAAREPIDRQLGLRAA